MDNVTRLAVEFSRLVRRDLAPHIAEIVRRNALPEMAGCCATHDFCDANMIMAEAFENVFVRSILPDDSSDMTDSDCAAWNAAWDMARAAGFNL